jgi:acyl-CoA dehydrogenase
MAPQVLTQEQELLKGTIREFSKAEVSPLAAKMDSDTRIPAELLSKLPELGLYSIIIPTQYGGAGADYLSLLLAVEELSKVSGTVGARVASHGAACNTLAFSTNDSLKSSILTKLSGGTIAAFSVDPRSTLSWKKNSLGEFILDGSSEYVMNADLAGVFLLLARSKEGTSILTCFEDTNKQVEVGELKKMMGLRGTGTCRISVKDLKVGKESLIVDPSETLSSVQTLLISARLAVASLALGIGQAALDEEISYANERTQFNTKIGKFYAVQDFIASDEIALESARSLTYMAASVSPSEKSSGKQSAVAKVAASNASVQSARHSIRVHGGYGFIREYPIERYLRDARATQIFLESNESLKAKIAEEILFS